LSGVELNLPGWASALLDAAPVARLGFLDERGSPRVLPITFAWIDGAAWSAVDDKPKRVRGSELARVRWLRANPRAALLVDDYHDDWGRLAWVQLLGRVAVLDDAEPPEALLDKYPAYRERGPAGPWLRLDVERALHWRAEDAQRAS
jgi:PPOX class probable F420-dependent enzyme